MCGLLWGFRQENWCHLNDSSFCWWTKHKPQGLRGVSEKEGLRGITTIYWHRNMQLPHSPWCIWDTSYKKWLESQETSERCTQNPLILQLTGWTTLGVVHFLCHLWQPGGFKARVYQTDWLNCGIISRKCVISGKLLQYPKDVRAKLMKKWKLTSMILWL